MNEAALLAAPHHAKTISQQDIEDAVEKVVVGPERKSRRLVEAEKRCVAYHEVGHAFVAAYARTPSRCGRSGSCPGDARRSAIRSSSRLGIRSC
jgi:ATP-dependent Zn protease